MYRLGPTLVLALAVTTSACSGHVADTSIAPGDRVRVTAPSQDLDNGVGTVTALESDTLVVNAEQRAEALKVPLGDVTKLEVHRGQKSRTGRGALIGAGVGAAVGVGLAAAICGGGNCEPSSSSDDLSGIAVAAAFVVGVGAIALGAGIGALIGLSSNTDRWVNVPLDQPRVGPSPATADGVAVSVSLRL